VRHFYRAGEPPGFDTAKTQLIVQRKVLRMRAVAQATAVSLDYSTRLHE